MTRLDWLSQLVPCFRVLLQNPRPGKHSVCFYKGQCPQVVSINSWRGEGLGLPLSGLPCPPAWILHLALGAFDYVGAHIQTREHNTKTRAAWGGCLLSVIKEPSTQHGHLKSRGKIILCSGLGTVQAFSIEFLCWVVYKPLFAPTVKRLARLSLSDNCYWHGTEFSIFLLFYFPLALKL